MPITLDQFEVQFNKLQASFGTVKSAKIFEEWFKEFEDEEYYTFLKAIKRCQYGDKFPTWAVFKAELKNARGVSTTEHRTGCGLCHGGVVLFRDLNREGQVSDQASNCGNCSEGRIPDMANVHPDRLHVDAVGTLRTRRALAKDLKDGWRIEEPKNREEAQVVNVKEMVIERFGKEDPDNERKRYGSLKREEEREARL
tara:strand:+ start:41 stop:634 length:594 start_codon:yes stop_codon:yes gene_type:complete